MSALWALASWAVFLSFWSLFRKGGFSEELGLPELLVRDGVSLPRRVAGPTAGKLPVGMVLLEAADYGTSRGPTIRLRRLALLSSGTGVHMPVEGIGPALLGPGASGRCVLLDSSGAVVRELATAAVWQAWIDSQPSSAWATLAWLSGLRPYRSNSCLWESLP